jgi:hypothetical protein
MTIQNTQLTPVEQKILNSITEHNILTPENVLEEITIKFHDHWWNNVPPLLREVWDQLSLESKLIAFDNAWLGYITSSKWEE